MQLSNRGLHAAWLLCAAIAATAAAEERPLSRIGFGSCARQDRPQPIWDAVVETRPELFLMLGDNIYGDTDDMAVLRAKYRQLGEQPGFKKLKQTCPVLATWDDHDYGANDAGAEYPKKRESQQEFLDFFGVPPDDPLRTQEGVYQARVFGPPGRRVQIILLDTRYFRSPLKTGRTPGEPGEGRRGAYVVSDDDEATMLGEAQWQWLAEQLRAPADVRIIASSVQAVADEHGWERWGNFPRERRRLLRLIRDSNAAGVIVLSGDRHLAEISRLPADDDAGVGYPLYDVTSSSLNAPSGNTTKAGARFANEINSHRVGLTYFDTNFGCVEIDWNEPDPLIRLQVRDEKGDIVLQQRVALSQLQPAGRTARWWKGNLHTHTFWSDGNDFPEMSADWYRSHGYHFLGLSDHNVLAQGMRWMKQAEIVGRGGADAIEKYRRRFGPAWVETRGEGDSLEVRLKPLDEFRALVEERGRFLMIPAEEISDLAEGVPVHINASNVKETLRPVGGATVREAITNNLRAVEEQAQRAGREILAHLNHPNFGWAVTAEDLAHAVIERHFEVYNGHPSVNHLGDERRPGVERIWDIANAIRLVDLQAPPLFGIATDDTHDYHGKPGGAHPGRGWVMVRATHLTPEYIVKAIKAGDCYATSGVTLADVRYDHEQRTLELAIEPDGDATYVTQFVGTLRAASTAGTGEGEEAVDVEGKPPTGKAGQPLRATRKYSDEIGKVLATVEGLRPRYELTGDELYVRGVVTSSKAPRDPSFKDQREQAWTQPVGWEAALETPETIGK